MQVWGSIRVAVEGKSSKIRALFDTGSSFTIMGYSILKELFGEAPIKPLPKPYEGALINGQKIVIDSYVDSQMVIDNYPIAERIYLAKDIMKEVMLKDREVTLPDLIIGYLTMETWGIELDLKGGKAVVHWGGFIL